MTLDPENPEAFRRAAHRLLDACLDQFEAARDHPWQPVPQAVRDGYRLDHGLGVGEAELAQRLAAEVLPHGTGNTHPRFFGWVHGTGLASGLMSELVAATMNANLGGRDHGAVDIERAVIDWARSVFGFPQGSSGVMVTGTSQATVIALACARMRALGPDCRAHGQGGAWLTAYAGAGVHNAAKKALELLGLGGDNLRAVPETAAGVDIAALRAAIAADRAAGARPFAIIGSAGTVDLGRFDDFHALADLAQEAGLWLHVDGAFGAWTRLAGAPWRGLTDGIERADSLACDFHKWMYVPYDCGMVLVRDEAEHRATFAARPSYLAGQSRGLAGGEPWFCDYGTDLSRGNRALKVWAALVAYGPDRLGAAITDNCARAAQMGALVAGDPHMALIAPVMSNLCVFTADARLDTVGQSALNTRIAQDLQLSGEAVFSTVTIGDVTGLRAAITNHRTQAQDVDRAIAAVARARDAR
ncbi:pyridoxal-dependent decarboxylase [Lutimaribacter sp. EGI FJ00015]|uniref:Pyridoxal-dependent decarboxylase n=1 Tax=Lutimaribacter degradans TaxID=2945989 RepID=A0ACC5ZS10_9RHOB|nr:pyridoxal-dependent decarboxylase [Lutimaribacter sp. EGI FJ00013]MCM2560925.1 pyridoxal-dependent decarboxylase [Lutimaribacter sp. EGI FJ00013]MCO0612129.1 pyridoxal-dependent decarboxylase [Lutimaribacter sp. EGI FJ00015]MCO0634751.1 pyridoxal-dependent decarboxylase [Lutimaribacter sp. EGI FJ00014]